MPHTIATSAKTVEEKPGIKRTVLADGDYQTMIEYACEAGAVYPVHSRPFEKTCYVLEGRVKYQVGNDWFGAVAGQAFVVPMNKIHSLTALDPTRLLAAYTPRRDDLG